MAADSSMGFQQGVAASSYSFHHMLSFRSNGDVAGDRTGTVMPSKGMTSVGGGFAGGTSSSAGLFLSPNTDGPSLSSPGNVLRGAVVATPNYTFVTGSPADWTAHELAVLKEGIVRYAHEPKIMKYIKIASMLPSRTIRDVALICWWTTGKERRRKPDEFYTGKKIRDMKDKTARCTSVPSFQIAPSNSVISFSMHPSQHCPVPREEVLVLDSATQHLLEENNQLLNQIAANIEISKMEENMNLFLHTNNNFKTIVNRMSETPGILGQMPPVPLSVNEDHLNSLLQLHRMVATYGCTK